MFDELDPLVFERLRNKAHSDEDIDVLEKYINQKTSQSTSQRGKYNVNANNPTPGSTTINIGDHYGAGVISAEIGDMMVQQYELMSTVKELLKVQNLEKEDESSYSTQEGSYGEDAPIPRLSIELVSIEKLNLQLSALDELNKFRQLSEKHRTEFNSAKSELLNIEKNLQKLNEASHKINRIHEESTQAFTQKIQELLLLNERLNESKLSKDPYGSAYLEQLSQNLAQRIQKEEKLKQTDNTERDPQIKPESLVENFQQKIQLGKEVTCWLNREKQDIAKSLVNHVLTTYPKIKLNSSERMMRLFTLSIEQFIERLAYCLSWGRVDSLVDPVTPVVLEDYAYVEAFEQLEREMPDNLPEGGKAQMREYIEYLKNSLESYHHIQVE